MAPSHSTPLRPEVTRLAIVLLFTTGIRRGELLNLTVGDYNRKEATLHIRETKFYKSRLLPINAQVADEIERYLRARTRQRLPIHPDTPLIWNATQGGRAYTGTGLLYCLRPLLRECGIRTLKGQPPRIHDLRHSFAVNALMRWYRQGATSSRSCRSWPPIWDTVRPCRTTTTFTSSSRFEQRPASGSPSTTAH